jgi:hypothetical protein
LAIFCTISTFDDTSSISSIFGLNILGRVNIDVIDCPCLSETPSQLREVLADYDAVVFADVCKAGPQFPLAGMIADLQSSGDLPLHWQAVGAVNTYNPLGNTSTFLSVEDVGLAVEKVLTSFGSEE